MEYGDGFFYIDVEGDVKAPTVEAGNEIVFCKSSKPETEYDSLHIDWRQGMLQHHSTDFYFFVAHNETRGLHLFLTNRLWLFATDRRL